MRRLFVTAGEIVSESLDERGERERISAPSSLKAGEAVRKRRPWLGAVCAIPYSIAVLPKL